jgi:hypothetical protein
MKTRMNLILPIALTTASLAGAAFAQTNGTFLLTTTSVVSPSAPSTTVEIWATWDDPANLYQFGGADYDITAGDGLFSGATNVMNGPGSTPGIANGNTITGGLNGTLHIPGLGWPRSNPDLMASYTWTATDFTPRTVDLRTSNTSIFIVALITTGQITHLFPGQFTPGIGGITVVPTPGAWLVLCLPFAVATRRRRSARTTSMEGWMA